MPNPAPAAAFWCGPQREAYVRTRLETKERAQCERVCAGDPACTGYVYGRSEKECELRGEVAKTDAVECVKGAAAPFQTPPV